MTYIPQAQTAGQHTRYESCFEYTVLLSIITSFLETAVSAQIAKKDFHFHAVL